MVSLAEKFLHILGSILKSCHVREGTQIVNWGLSVIESLNFSFQSCIQNRIFVSFGRGRMSSLQLIDMQCIFVLLVFQGFNETEDRVPGLITSISKARMPPFCKYKI